MNVMIDFGGTLVRESYIFNDCIKSNDILPKYFGSDSWAVSSTSFKEEIKKIGLSYIDKCLENMYPCIADLCGWLHENGDKIYIVFDNKPIICDDQKSILDHMENKLKEKSIYFDGCYVESDKVKMSKILGIDVLIEDDPRVAIAVANTNVRVLLVLREHNKHFDKKTLNTIIPYDKKNKIYFNLHFAEDFVDCKHKIKKMKD